MGHWGNTVGWARDGTVCVSISIVVGQHCVDRVNQAGDQGGVWCLGSRRSRRHRRAPNPAPAPGCRRGLYAAVDGTLDPLAGYLDDSAHDKDRPSTPRWRAAVVCSSMPAASARNGSKYSGWRRPLQDGPIRTSTTELSPSSVSGTASRSAAGGRTPLGGRECDAPGSPSRRCLR